MPPGWHGWLHHTVDVPPTEDKTKPYPWEKPHRPNLTGTPAAHRPSGSTLAQGRRPKATGDYKAWTPGGESGSATARSPFPCRIRHVNRANARRASSDRAPQGSMLRIAALLAVLGGTLASRAGSGAVRQHFRRCAAASAGRCSQRSVSAAAAAGAAIPGTGPQHVRPPLSGTARHPASRRSHCRRLRARRSAPAGSAKPAAIVAAIGRQRPRQRAAG